MSHLPQIEIEKLAIVQSDTINTENTYSGFKLFRQAEKSLKPSTINTISNKEDMISWFSYVNSVEKKVPALGCYEIESIHITSHGLLFNGKEHVREVSHIADVASLDAENIVADKPMSKKTCKNPGVSIIGPGYKVYGHWLVDFIPRVKIAQALYGHDLGGALIPLPTDTPKWALNLLSVVAGISSENIVFYDMQKENIFFSKVIVPTYAHASYHFHPAMSGFYPRPAFHKPFRKICITRKNYETETSGVLKKLVGRDLFEKYAISRGYELFAPEDFTVREQISIFREAGKIVGEYGSALHNALFSNAGVTIGMIRCPNDVQLRISALRQQPVVLLLPENEWIADSGAQTYDLSQNSIERFFDEMEMSR